MVREDASIAPLTRAVHIKITSIETVVVNAEMRNWIFVKVRTNQDGLYGWGEASLNWKTRAVCATIEDLAPLIIGRDPRDIEQCVQALKKQSFYRLGIIGMAAISGLEHALWDIFGRSVGLPVWALLGGKVRDKVRIYTHLGLGDMKSVYDESFDVGKLRELGAAVAERGYNALKAVFIPCGHYHTEAGAAKQVGQLMSTLREAVGNKVDIMIDFHGRPASPASALAYIRELEPYDPMFCEEPVQPGDTAALAEVKARAKCPIASGERLVGFEEFMPVLNGRALDIVQPDLNHMGGLLEGKRVASLAAANMIGVAPHNPNGPLAGAAALHFAVSTPNFVIQEEMSGAVPWYADVVDAPLTRVGSYWAVPDVAGLGVEINEKEAAKHPFQQEVMRAADAVMSDGTIVDW